MIDNGEYQSDIGERVTQTRLLRCGAHAYLLLMLRTGPAIFFGIHRDHSPRLRGTLRSMGIRAEHVDGDDPAGRRDRIMNEFRTGGLDVVGNCDLISEGFDAPRCDVAMLGSPTRSVTRYLQQAGRAMRPREGKEALVLDLAGISARTGPAGRGAAMEPGGRGDARAEEGARPAARLSTVLHGVLRAGLPRMPAR